ncbi:uncharacterized protein LOC123266122 [Cotesia glomerata]|uniref:uncharacterized protein LOC123266122 n=1 Tax=Cotesia glomerata TaxID=32391 RepID=UPI001D019379|nr:uncharacterized protein LOC123266122 [Cotesia glomerata]
MNEVRQEINDIKKSQEAFQQVVTAALQTILSNWQQIQSTRATVPTAVQAIDFENIKVPPPVGFVRTDTEMIHCGQNVWITVQDYNNAKAAAGTDAIFVKNIAVNIFTRDVLKTSSITGKRSNRTKGPAKPKLDPIKMLAVRGIYRHYLKKHRQLSEKHINEKIDDYVEYIRGKISDLERPKKIPFKKTEKEEANEIEKKADGKKKKSKARIRKKKFLAPVTVVVLVKKVLILRVKLVAMKTPGRLTGKVIDKLTVYYGLSIRRHYDSIEDMKSAIMATFYHYGSTDENPNHDMCPKGEDSWCSYQRAEASGELDTYTQDYSPLPPDVLKAIKPIYDDLSNDNLLSRCVGGFNQNNNESFNQLVWEICPKTVNTSSTIVQIAAYIATCIFNEGTNPLLMIMDTLGLNCGSNSHRYAEKLDAARVQVADQRANDNTREGRMLHR